MNSLAGKGKGRLKGAERRKMWEEVKELRKEFAHGAAFIQSTNLKPSAPCLGIGSGKAL